MSLLGIAALVLIAGVVLALALRDNRRRAQASIATQAVATALALVDVVPVLLGGGEVQDVFAWSYPTETIALALDPLSAFFLAWSLPLTLLGTIYAVGYLRPHYATRHAGVQFALLNLTALSFVMIYTLQSAMVFLLGWELAAVAAWLLVIWDYRNQKIRFAGFNYLVSTHVGLFVLVAAFMVMHSQTGSMDFRAFGDFLAIPSPLRNLTFVLLVVSFGLKSAFFPLHTWLPRAHSAAPAHVSALMSGVIHKAGLYGLLRFTLLMGEPEPWMGWFLLTFSALSALMGVLYTTTQRDLKRLLGYSSTENVGIAGLGFGLGTLGLAWHQPALVALGFGAGLLHLLNHAVFKCLLFYAAGAIYRAAHTVDLERLGGLARTMPWTAGSFLVGGLAIAGLPPLNGFVSEFLLYAGLLGPSGAGGLERVVLIATAALLAFVGGVSALAIARAFGVAFLGSPRDPAVHPTGDIGLAMRLPMVVLAGLAIVLGLVPGLGVRLVERAAGLFVARVPGADPAVLAAPAALVAPVAGTAALFLGVLATLVLARRWLARGAPAVRQVTWGCGYPQPSPRMQYTGASFSAALAGRFAAVLPHLRRASLPTTAFPEGSGHLATHSVDAVERRMFEVLGEGDDLVQRLGARIPEEPRFSFGLGLVVLAALVAFLLSSGACR